MNKSNQKPEEINTATGQQHRAVDLTASGGRPYKVSMAKMTLEGVLKGRMGFPKDKREE